jgi:hypothetical protein
MMYPEIGSAMNRALSHPRALAEIRIMNTRWNAKSTIMAITHHNATAHMVLRYHDNIITAGRTVNQGVVDVKENEYWATPRLDAVPVVAYMAQGMEVL